CPTQPSCSTLDLGTSSSTTPRASSSVRLLPLRYDALAPHLSMHPLDEGLLIVDFEGRMPAALPVEEQVEARAAGHLQVDHLGCPLGVFVGEQHLRDEGARRLTGPNRAALMGIQAIRAHLDVDWWAIRHTFEQVDREGWCLQQKAVTAFRADGMHRHIEPVRD